MLLASGEYDEICDIEQQREFFNMLNCPKEIWILENQFHSCASMIHELFPWALDWLKDMLIKDCPPGYKKEKFIEARY